MDTKKIFDRCHRVAKQFGINSFEVAFEKAKMTSIQAQDSKVDHLSQSTDQGISIRTLQNSKMGFAYTFDLSDSAIEKTFQAALQIAELMPSDKFNSLGGSLSEGFKESLYPSHSNVDNSGLSIPLKTKIDQALLLESAAKKADSRIKKVRKASVFEMSAEISLLHSNGNSLHYPYSLFSAALMCIAEDGSSSETGYDSMQSHFYNKLNFDRVVDTATKDAVQLLGAKGLSTRTCPVVFKNSVTSDLVEFITASFSAENIDKNFSMLIGKLGQQIFSKKLTLTNDSTLTSATGFSPFDAEGNPAQKTCLIRNGVIENFLYDDYYAAKAGKKSTSSLSRSSLKAPPSLSTSNLIMNEGTHSFEALINEAQNGVFITDLLGLHTANPVTGEFSVGASGLLIENGKLTTPVKGFAIAGNLIDILGKIEEVGNDAREFGSTRTSSVLVSSLAISGA